MATYALLSDNTRLAVLVKDDRLVTAIGTRDEATAAADTFLAVYLGEYHCLAIEIGRHNDIGQFLAHQFFEFDDTTLLHIMLQTEFEVIDDTVALLHNRRTNLYVAAAELQELQCIAPGLYTAYTADVHVFLYTGLADNRMTCHLVDHA